MISTSYGPVRLAVETPLGWTLRLADPRLEPFRRDTHAAPLTVPLRIGIDPGPVHELEEVAVTTGWRLEASEGRFRWTLPDCHDGWFWRLTSDAEGASVELGPALVDRASSSLIDPVTYPLDQILVIHHLPRRDGLLLHAAAVAQDGRAVVAIGVSGAGKTTVSRLLREARPDLEGLSDDRVIAAPADSGNLGGAWEVWGTPWSGEGLIASPTRARVVALVLLRHAEAEQVRSLDPSTALERILPATSVPWYAPPLAARALGSLAGLIAAVPAWELAFRPVPQAVTPLLEFLG